MKKNVPEWREKKLFYHDNAPVYSSFFGQQKLAELRFNIVQYLQYSPDLTSSDFFLKLKKFLVEKRISTNNEVIVTVNEYFDELEGNHFQDGMLEKRCKKCIELRGDYVEA